MRVLLTVRPYPGKSRNFAATLRCAIQGVISGIIWERSIRIELLLFVAAIVLGWWFSLSAAAWAALLLVSAGVFITELLNSSIEALADAVHPDYSEHIQRAKDMAAGAVLVVSLTAVITGLLIFWPHLTELIDRV